MISRRSFVLALASFSGALVGRTHGKPAKSRDGGEKEDGEKEGAGFTVKVNPAENRGVWEGWGTSLCWMGNVFGENNDVADFLFTMKMPTFKGKTAPGLGLNIVRYNAGACSWNEVDGRKMKVSKIIRKYRQMESFWLDGKNADPGAAGWDWKVDARQRAMLGKAKERGADRFELFSNSPPWWMCANDNPSGAARATDDNLPVANHGRFAIYLAAVARVAKERWGIPFTTVSPFNEPVSSWWFADCKQEGCHFSPEAQRRFLPLLRAELDKQGLKDLPIAASDETHYDHAVDTWRSFPPEVKELVAQVNVHGYQYEKGRRAELYQATVKEDGKRLWNSEYGDGDGSGLEMARNLHRDMAELRPTAWCYWQPMDGGGWGLLDCQMERGQIRGVNPKAQVLAQYTRHIRPGMRIIGTDDRNTVAAFSEKEKRLGIVVLNDGPARQVDFDLGAFGAVAGPVESAFTRVAGDALYQRQGGIAVKGKGFGAKLAEKSVTTFEVKGVG